ncbi:unnamed protein product [Tenebrio molitor]|nr:unnamed protein product [Tenebrio molitor]
MMVLFRRVRQPFLRYTFFQVKTSLGAPHILFPSSVLVSCDTPKSFASSNLAELARNVNCASLVTSKFSSCRSARVAIYRCPRKKDESTSLLFIGGF